MFSSSPTLGIKHMATMKTERAARCAQLACVLRVQLTCFVMCSRKCESNLFIAATPLRTLHVRLQISKKTMLCFHLQLVCVILCVQVLGRCVVLRAQTNVSFTCPSPRPSPRPILCQTYVLFCVSNFAIWRSARPGNEKRRTTGNDKTKNVQRVSKFTKGQG